MEEVLALRASDAAVLRADDPRRDGPLQAEGLSQRQDPLADVDLVAVAQRGRRKILRPLDAEDGQVGLRIALHLGSREFPAVPQPDHDPATPCNDVIIGENHARGIDDHPRAGAYHAAMGHLRRLAARQLVEELAELRILEQIAESHPLNPKGMSSSP